MKSAPLIKWVRPAVGVVLCSALLAACSGSKPATSPAPTPAPSADKAAASPKPLADYSKFYPKLWSISEDGPEVPGLAEGAVPQGIAYWKEKNWLVISSYSETGPSTLAVVDAATQKPVKQVSMNLKDGSPYGGHAGGVAVTDRHVWISSGGDMFGFPVKDLESAADGGKVTFTERFSTPTRASLTSYADGILWVGEFYTLPDYPTDESHTLKNNVSVQYHAWAAGYVLDKATGLPQTDRQLSMGALAPNYVFSIPDKIQGMALSADSVYLSQSYGRNKESALLKYQKPDLAGQPHQTIKVGSFDVPVWFLDQKVQNKQLGSLPAPPMTEGIVTDGASRLYVLFESGAQLYRPTALNPMDRVRTIRLDDWAKAGS